MEPKVGCFDIETTWANFKADTSHLLSYAIKTVGKDELVTGLLRKEDLEDTRGREDKRLIKELLKDLRAYDMIITFYGKRFDATFIRTRALINGVKFPGYGSLQHVDVYDIVKHKFSIRPCSQENACKQLVGTAKKIHPGHLCWRNASRGDAKALQVILKRNISDVLDLEQLWLKVRDFARKNDTSI